MIPDDMGCVCVVVGLSLHEIPGYMWSGLSVSMRFPAPLRERGMYNVSTMGVILIAMALALTKEGEVMLDSIPHSTKREKKKRKIKKKQEKKTRKQRDIR
eukprot:TRINITY_DN2887_c2_g1::TRINITY_DN2887_c2_g1_i10::g.5067::m.5067 TRINITY_DN2887_c2_g1::TRINITY_DN2887_c2_g1_i10::g.5067  ORF type:complete len:100 (+),score=10.32 TRINITY_DN2887_c2_g1_i10:564-863(+)